MTSPGSCEWGDKHASVAIRSGWLRKRWWVCCWDCDLKLGPCPSELFATQVRGYVDRYGLSAFTNDTLIRWVEDGLVDDAHGLVEETVRGYTTPPN